MAENRIVETSLGTFQLSEPLKKGWLFKSDTLTWIDAMTAARDKGSAWSLPTLEQMAAIHAETDFFDDISAENVYWCNDQYEEDFDCAYIYDLSGVLTGVWNKTGNFNALALKTLKY